MGSLSEKTPSQRVRVKNTPGSGEALLRGQVKSLLKRVEEETKFVNMLLPSFVEEDGIKNAPLQIAEPVISNPPESCSINRALLFDSPDKSEASVSSVSTISSSLTYQLGSGIEHKSSKDDSSSAWSIQVNLSIQDDDDEEEEEIEDFYKEEEDNELFDELCEGLNKMTVEEKVGLPEFTGKLTRFVYNSDGDLEGEEVLKGNCRKVVSPSVVVLKGLPVPEGKHLRFHDEEDE